MLQEDSDTSLFAFGSRKVEQRPSVGVTDLGRVSLFQHPADSADVARRHRRLDLQLIVKLRVPSALMVQHPAKQESPAEVPLQAKHPVLITHN